MPNLPNVSETSYVAGFMTSKAEWSAAEARQSCTGAHRMTIRVGLTNKPKKPKALNPSNTRLRIVK